MSLAIPGDIGVAGFDDTQWTTLVDPNITVVAQPTMEMGRAATELLLDRINSPEIAGRKITLSDNLIVRQSTLNK